MNSNKAKILELNMDENKKKALSAALGQIEKQFGKGSVMRLRRPDTLVGEVYSTGSIGLDVALGIRRPSKRTRDRNIRT